MRSPVGDKFEPDTRCIPLPVYDMKTHKHNCMCKILLKVTQRVLMIAIILIIFYI